MKTVSAAILVLILVIGSLMGWQSFSRADTFVIGGDFVIPASQSIHGNLRALFAQVKLADGARIDGKITAVSSTLDLAGSVNGPILAVGSDVTLRASAHLAADPEHVTAIPFVILLPAMLRGGNVNVVR